MFTVHSLAKSFGSRPLFRDVSFSVGAGDRLGIVGPNGCGKSTLLRILAGIAPPDHGSVAVASGVTVGYLAQDHAFPSGASIASALRSAVKGLGEAEREMLAAADRLGLPEADHKALAHYDDALGRFESLGGYGGLARSAAMAEQLGLGAVPPETPVVELSGGQKTRLALACMLASQAAVLLLDEPTNHLDIEALEWLEAFLARYGGAVVAVSHDRAFLDAVCDSTLLFEDTGQVRRLAGGYSVAMESLATEREALARTFRAQEEYVARVRSDIARLKGEALAIERSTTARQPSIRKLARRKAAVAKARESKLDRFLASDERVERPRLSWSLHLDFGTPPESGREALRARGLTLGYGDGAAVLAGVDFDILHGDRVAVLGPNGAGKTTLLRGLNGQLPPREGSIWSSSNVRMATLTQEQETLDRDATVLETVRAARAWDETAARSFLHFFLFAGDAVFRRVGLCSPGERARLQLADAILRGANVLVLDEPLNHLDIASREQFETALDAFPGTVIVVAHDRYFLRRFSNRALDVRGGRVREVFDW
jgi:ATP-binding cassette subfamily F protein 3